MELDKESDVLHYFPFTHFQESCVIKTRTHFIHFTSKEVTSTKEIANRAYKA